MFPITSNAVGDIIALTQLAIQIARAVNETRGAAVEWRELHAQFTSIHRLLQLSQPTIASLEDVNHQSIVLEQLEIVSERVKEGLLYLARFDTDFATAENLREQSELAARAKRAWGSVKWEFLRKTDVLGCRRKISGCFEPLTFALLMCVPVLGVTRLVPTNLRSKRVQRRSARDASTRSGLGLISCARARSRTGVRCATRGTCNGVRQRLY